MKTRDKWHKHASKANNPDAWSSYRNLKREVKQRLGNTERAYKVKQIKENPNDSNCLWKVIHLCIPKRETSTKPFAKEEKIVANDFFCYVGLNTVKEIHSFADEFNCNSNRSPFVPRSYPTAANLHSMQLHSSYFLPHNRLTVNQRGNKQWHSTETSLIKTSDVILKASDDKKLTAVVLQDMSKASDSLHHDILIGKLKDVELSFKASNWFTSYLTDQYQSVCINFTLSEAFKLESGIHQGSIFGTFAV